MPNALARLKTALQGRAVDPSILGELETEYAELHKKADELERPPHGGAQATTNSCTLAAS